MICYNCVHKQSCAAFRKTLSDEDLVNGKIFVCISCDYFVKSNDKNENR